MYVRKTVVHMGELLVNLQKALLEVAEKHQDVIMPGYTHLQRAQPVLFCPSYDGLFLHVWS